MNQLSSFGNTDEMDLFLSMVESASDKDITKIISAIIRRYNRLYPDWEILFLSVPKDPEQRTEQLEHMLELLKTGALR